MANPSQGGGGSTGTVGAATDQAKQTARQELETAGEVAATAKHEAAAVTQTAGDEVRHLYTEVRTGLSSEADDQLHRLSGSARSLADELRSMASSADDPDGPGAKVVRQAAHVVGGLGEHLDGGTEDLLRQVRRTARQRPGLFLLGALGAGFVIGRMARNMAQEPTEEQTIDLTERGFSGVDPSLPAGSGPSAGWGIDETTVAAAPPVGQPAARTGGDLTPGGRGPGWPADPGTVAPPQGGGTRG